MLSERSLAALCLPLARAHLRCLRGDEISATDATPSRWGSVRAPLEARWGDALYRLCEFRGEQVRLDWSDRDIAEKTTRMERPQSDVHAVIESLDWRVAGATDFSNIHHVNIQ